MQWYVGPSVPLQAWEWMGAEGHAAGRGTPPGRVLMDGRRQRRGENGNGNPSAFVERTCLLNASEAAAAGRQGCGRFPIECIGGVPRVRPGCALVRPLPSAQDCRAKPEQPTCATPRVRMSHAWPRRSEVSPDALAIDPSINMLMSYVAAPALLYAHSPSPATLKFIILLREPTARAQSSARMMLEWRWEKRANVTEALLADLSALRRCCDELLASSRRPSTAHAAAAPAPAAGERTAATTAPWASAAQALRALGAERSAESGSESGGAPRDVRRRALRHRPALRTAPATEPTTAPAGRPNERPPPAPTDAAAVLLLRTFRTCLAHHSPLNHARASLYAAGLLGFYSAGFSRRQFLYLETEAMRAMGAADLLAALGRFAGLPTAHLTSLPPDVHAACQPPPPSQRSRPGGGGGVRSAPTRRRGGTPRRHAARGTARRLAALAASRDAVSGRDERMTSHVHRALPADVARALHAAFAPFNALLAELLEGSGGPPLHGVPWLHGRRAPEG